MATSMNMLAELLAESYNLDLPNQVDDLTVWSPRAGDPVGVFVEYRLFPEPGTEQVSVWTWEAPIFTLALPKNTALSLAMATEHVKIYGPIIRSAFALCVRLTGSYADLVTATKRIEEQEAEINRLKATISTMSAERGIIRDS